MNFKEVIIDKKTAEMMLNTSRGNPRYSKQNKVNRTAVEKYASDMRNGRWQLTPAPIAFNEKGELIDGHHRLAAIIESDVSVQMVVAYNVPTSTLIFDRNLKRTTSQYIRFAENIDKVLASGQVLSAVKLFMAYERGSNETTIKAKRNEAEKITDSEVVDFIRENEGELLFCANVVKSSGHGDMKSLMENSSCICAFFSAIKAGVEREKIKEFAKIVRTGLYDSKEQTAAIMARNYLVAHKSHDFETAVNRMEYIQTCLLDFVRRVPRERKYVKTSAYFTNKLISENKGGKT